MSLDHVKWRQEEERTDDGNMIQYCATASSQCVRQKSRSGFTHRSDTSVMHDKIKTLLLKSTKQSTVQTHCKRTECFTNSLVIASIGASHVLCCGLGSCVDVNKAFLGCHVAVDEDQVMPWMEYSWFFYADYLGCTTIISI